MKRIAPKEWQQTPELTGDHILDESIRRIPHADTQIRKDLLDYVTPDEAYGPITGYSGYHGYRGDN